ncbi:hypothetical protein C0993_005308 [Termitomyces sp. T159_Od127]|nr:hypothetical protein C0993_005308 [Termitomyces sp. T159_Od127]
MATYMHTYQPTGYQTNAYGRPMPENFYTMSTSQSLYPAPPIKHYPTLVPRYWALDQNQVPYGSSISQGIPQDWRRNSLQATKGTHQRVLPGVPSSHTPPSFLGCQQVKAYIQQRDKVLQLLRISPAEFARRARALLVSLGHNDLSGTLKQWADRLLKFHELYQHGAIPEMDKIHTSPTPWHFEDSVDPAHSFYMQHKELIELWDSVPAPVPHQQEELNTASNILKALNSTGGLFDSLPPAPLVSQCAPVRTPSPAPSTLGDNPLTPIPALTLLPTSTR